MYTKLQKRLNWLVNLNHRHLFDNSAIGLEKESLRVNSEGSIAQSPHPAQFGSALTHPFITTDYSEALIEFVTPPKNSINDALSFLRDAQQFVYRNLDNELLWATSMPCVVAGETSIPLAEYGSSNTGMMKHVYRRGLGYRYGRVMQVIAGVHFNYSLPSEFWPLYSELENNTLALQDFTSESYMGLIRNLQRFGWLIPYLFGASPAICKSFLGDASTSLENFDQYTYYGRYATSLRMGDIGYQNNKENEHGVKANYDSLQKYVESLITATETPCPDYEKIGILVDGEYRQLNANILQIENEYYSTVRPKQILNGNEKPSLALKRRGIAYIELRSLDVNAFDPLGINERQLQFLEAFLVFCLLHESPSLTAQEAVEIDENELLTAHQGRDPELKLTRNGKKILLHDWALEICSEMDGICGLLDANLPSKPYKRSLDSQRDKVVSPELTPSARMLEEMRVNQEPFFLFAKRMSNIHQHFFLNCPVTESQEKFFTEASNKSVEDKLARESADDHDFTEYLKRYFAQQ